MKTSKVIFFLRKDKLNKLGKAPIYCRILVNGRSSKFSIGRDVIPQRWKDTDRLQTAKKAEDRELVFYMDSIRNRIKELEREFLDARIPLTAESIKDAYAGKTGKTKKSKTLIEVFEFHNRKLQELVKSGQAAPGTLDRYKQSEKHLREYLKFEFQKTDILLEELEYSFVKNFDHYLRTERKNEKGRIRKCANNSTVKYISNFRKVIRVAIDEDWLTYDPFIKYKRKIFTVQRQFLTPEEIELMWNKEISIPRLAIVRDIFLFAVFTGYGYADVKKLTHDHIQRLSDNELWIITTRQKTRVPENVMLLYPALQLIEKYKSHPECLEKGTLFPVPSNQKTNAYLKEIADICGIRKNLTFHIGRHSFATSIMLANGASLETTRDIIGHLNLKQTQHYAKMQNPRLSDEMKKVNEKFKPNKDDNEPDEEADTPVTV